MNFEDFQKRLKKEGPEPLYLFAGSEKYLLREAVNQLKETALEESSILLNFAEISVSTQGASDLIAAAEQYPMFGGRRLIIARDFDKVSDAELDALKEYLKNPQPSTILVFQSDGLDKRRNISTALLKSCLAVEFNPLKEREAAEWAAAYLRKNGYSIAPNSAGLLIGLTGTDLFTVVNELEKLIAMLGRPGGVSVEDIEKLTVRSREHSNFELGDAVTSGERKRALRLLSRQLEDHAEPVMLLGIIARTLRQMLAAKELMLMHAPPGDIAKEIGMPPFRVAEFLTSVRKWETAKIERGIKRAAEVDLALKSSLGRPELQLEYLICELL